MNTKNARQLKIMKEWRLTYTQAWAISCIGGRMKTRVRPKLKSSPVKMPTIRNLVARNLVMWVDDWVMLTSRGENCYKQMHPFTTKYGNRRKMIV